MPYQRAISPFSLETYEPSADDITSDELPASDDELTEAERAAKRQRIEKLAESYLQGKPLFILSASLKGPFEQGWRNPWKKDRKAVVSRQAKTRGKRVIQNAGRVVQETDLRHPKYREDLAVAAPSPAAAISRIAQSPNAQGLNAGSPVTSRSAQKRPLQAAIHDEQHRVTPRSIKKPKETPSWRTNDHSFAAGGPADWLKKDRKRLNFTQYEPPSSPTSKIVSRQAENKARVGAMRTMELRPPATTSRRRISITPAVDEGTRTAERMDISLEGSRVAAATERNHDQIVVRSLAPGPQSTHGSSPSVEIPVASSFRVISSTSQLPRFEYRRWHQTNDSSQAGQQSPIKAVSPAAIDTSVKKPVTVSGAEKVQEDLPSEGVVAEVQDAPAAGSSENASAPSADIDAPAQIDQPVVSDAPVVTEQLDDAVLEQEDPEEPNEPLERPVDDDPKEASEAELVQTSKDLRFADEAGLSTYIEEEDQPQTEQNTYENLPSAQHVPVPPGVSDRIPSLYSTAMPRTNPDQNTEESSDTQLSTQAALLHAQRSFQEDLDSPEPEFIYPAEPEDTVMGPEEESILAQETPYNGPQASEAVHHASLRGYSKERIQAMSTQCMIDAVTPYIFSTEKKSKAFRELSPDQPKERPEVPPDLLVVSPRMPSPSQDHEYHRAHSSPHGPDPALTHRSTTQGTALPFALSGSTPTTAQDGQGAPPGVENFDLSQAIADAGSWLQQSFDFMKDIRRPSQPARPA
ncbi:uncharacterized protein N7473_004691 [Penicillium subrubescens]|uniref:Uncharacterized protein n=1 Tax=Penicillium subrubescens TaxID=1316194 RepID=A0A1Q5UHN2_9EURO|nr:uncharacterized protein N7473_004691 [Penicillium subrubescens]KAJ5900621.1 hypothetical protein N7473_004691 [Penicillium subrubescens]OKP11986.1 hypothetical protein PENSUB_2538 [Penicillium subrubescens]